LPRNLQQSTTTSQVARINRTLVELGQNGHGQISIYQNQPPAKRDEIAEALKRLVAAFPKLDQEVVFTIIDRATALQMPIQQVIDGINHTIDTCEYLNFTPAKVLNFDTKFDIYSYNQACEIQYQNGGNKTATGGTLLSKIKINGALVWVKTIDKQRFNLPDEINY